MRVRGLRERAHGGRSGAPVAAAVLLAGAFVLLVSSCTSDKPQFQPDATLRRELGLTDHDRVHRVTLVGADTEQVRPATVSVSPGAYVEFVTGDWRVHEVHFELDSLDDAARSFLQGSDQVSSPPLVDRDSRFVVRFAHAPPGRYPFVVRGNGAPGRGVVVVRSKP